MVRVVCLVPPAAGARTAPVPLPVPTVTAPVISPRTAQGPGVDLNWPFARRRGGFICDYKRAGFDRRPGSISIGSAQSERAKPT